MDERELGRRGVVGRDGAREREVDRGARPNSILSTVAYACRLGNKIVVARRYCHARRDEDLGFS